MGENSAISWTDHTFNPWWGCIKVSPGCTNCYAETFSKRVGWDIWGPESRRRFFGDKHWNEPLKWNRDAEKAGVRRKVFCGSMCDWAEGRDELDGMRWHLFRLIERTPSLDWLLLTKRPENILGLIPEAWKASPLPNVWMGTTTENQKYADERIPLLLQVPAAVRFLSAEPLVGPVDLSAWLVACSSCGARPSVADTRWRWNGNGWEHACHGPQVGCFESTPNNAGIHWVICGGESGHKARPMHPQWARDLRDQCKAGGVAYFFKQMGCAWTGKATDHGSDPNRWHEDFRVQEFPT
jgi:protein gp37